MLSSHDEQNQTSPASQDQDPERASDAQVRERFQREKPTLEALLASGDFGEPMPQADLLRLLKLLGRLRALRAKKGLSLADVFARSGIDRAAISRLENGLSPNPTLSTLDTYAHALGVQIQFVVKDLGNPPATARE